MSFVSKLIELSDGEIVPYNDNRKSNPVMTSYEYSRLLGMIVEVVQRTKSTKLDAVKEADRMIRNGDVQKIVIRRMFENGASEDWYVNELHMFFSDALL